MKLTADQIAQFERDGYLFFPGMFTPEEMQPLLADVPRLYAMERSMFVTFLVSWAGFILLGFALWRLELRGKLLAQGVQRLEKRLRGEAVLP